MSRVDKARVRGKDGDCPLGPVTERKDNSKETVAWKIRVHTLFMAPEWGVITFRCPLH